MSDRTALHVPGDTAIMSRGAYKFRQTEVLRAIKAARASGAEIAGIEIGPGGEIRVIFGKPVAKEWRGESSEWDAYDEAQAKVRQAIS